MNQTLKYIIIKTMRGERAILFPQEICHCDVYQYDKVISAGFVVLDTHGVVEVFGDAESFKTTPLKKVISYRPEDKLIIYKTLTFGLWNYDVDMEDTYVKR